MNYCKEKLSKEYILNLYSKCGTSEQTLGLEYERLPIYKSDKSALSYYGEIGVCEILKEFAREDNWDYILDNNEIIGLKKLHETITLEPGAQVELSLQPSNSISEIKSKVDEIDGVLKPVFDRYGIELLTYGVSPKTTYKNIKLIPKERYKYMANYLWGILSDVMMRETASIQVGIDYRDEADAIRKFNLSNKLAPFMTAMFANSKTRGSVNTGYKSFRALAWLNTDNERCGFATKFNKNMGFKDYVSTLFDVPMIYIVRDGKVININGKIDFKTFLKDGYMGFEPTFDDYKLHSNLFFPEVRLRNYLEIRNHDCCEEKYMYSLLAIYKGIYYNPLAIDAVENLVSKISYNDLIELRYNVPRTALDTKIKDISVKDITKEILLIADDSLKSLKDDERKFLEPIMELNSQGLSPVDISNI